LIDLVEMLVPMPRPIKYHRRSPVFSDLVYEGLAEILYLLIDRIGCRYDTTNRRLPINAFEQRSQSGIDRFCVGLHLIESCLLPTLKLSEAVVVKKRHVRERHCDGPTAVSDAIEAFLA
jgi:hypothetical protein